MLLLTLNYYLTIKLRKWRNLLLKHNNIDSWPLPPITSLLSLRNHLIRLQVLSGNIDSLLNLLGLYRISHLGLKISHSPLPLILGRTFSKRSNNVRQFPSSKPASSSTKLWKPTPSTTYLTTSRHSRWRKIGQLCRNLGRINSKQMGPIYRQRRIQHPIQFAPTLSTVPIVLS